MPDISKQQMKLIRQFASLAHERELNRVLAGLKADFDRWEVGELSPQKLSAQIHEHNKGTLKNIWTRYYNSSEETLVALAIANGILQEEELPEDVLNPLGKLIQFFREERSRRGDVD